MPAEQPSRLVSDEKMEELKARLKKKLFGQLNSGFDPETIEIGLQLAVGHIERGITKFADFAKRMIDDLGDAIRPYLKSFYNGARDFPGAEQYAEQMTPYDEVRTFDVLNFDKDGQPKDLIATAQQIAKEHEIEKKAQAEKKKAPKRNKKEESTLSEQTSLFSSEETATPNEQPAVEDEQEEESSLKYNAEQRKAMSEVVTSDLLTALQEGTKPYRNIVYLRRRAKSLGLDVDEEGRDDVALQEMVEDGLVRAARYMVESGNYGELGSLKLYMNIVRLYELQPTISRRSSNRVKMQQYSTPLPMAFMADSFAWRPGMKRLLEPTAGNGMLVFGIPANSVVVNELDEARLANLKEQGFMGVMNEDATGDKVFMPKAYDAVIANPPFGKAEAKEYDGKSIAGLEEQITLNALAAMKDDGRAAIIIGGNMEYAKNGTVNNNKAFWTYLYDHYNVKGVVDMDGKLYAKQGTTYPTRMIIIDGRRSEDERAQSTVYPPRKFEAVRKAETFDDLYNIVNEINQSNTKTNGNEVLRGAGSPASADVKHDTTNDNVQHNPVEHHEDVVNGRGGRGRGERTRDAGRNGDAGVQQTQRESGNPVRGLGLSGVHGTQGNQPGEQGSTNTSRGAVERPGRDGQADTRADKQPANGDAERVRVERVPNDGNRQQQRNGLKEQPKQRTVEDEKLPYRPHNTAFSLESVAPAAMVEAMDKTLAEIEKVHGMSIDEFVTSELGYDSIDEMHNALAAEQVDSVAMGCELLEK